MDVTLNGHIGKRCITSQVPILKSERKYIWVTEIIPQKLIMLHDTASYKRHAMETFSTLLALYEGNPSFTGEFPSQRASNAGLWGFVERHAVSNHRMVDCMFS